MLFWYLSHILEARSGRFMGSTYPPFAKTHVICRINKELRTFRQIKSLNYGRFPHSQKFQKFWLEIKWNGPFQSSVQPEYLRVLEENKSEKVWHPKKT